MKLLVEQLGENDRVAIVVYAEPRGAGPRLDLVRSEGRDPLRARTAPGRRLDQRRAGDPARLRLAARNFIPGGTNRVILATDGDFNVGVTERRRARPPDRGEGRRRASS